MEKLLSVLQQSVLFKGKTRSEIADLLAKINYRVKEYRESEIIFSINHLADTLGIILEGEVDVKKDFCSGKVITVTTRSRFDLLADAAMFGGTQYYPGTLFASKPSKILLLNKKDLLQLFALEQTVMLNFLCSVSRRMLVLNQKIEILSLSSIQSKIAHFLISESQARRSAVIVLSFSKKAWAEHLNVSRTSLSRELRQLERDDLISFHKRTIRIKQLDKLQELLAV
ncbi:MAG: cyclic nucleotide-binding protein [Firmicutes bacterium]|nr:cyclic nucleotide-binding protein [Bacillota bacterium]